MGKHSRSYSQYIGQATVVDHKDESRSFMLPFETVCIKGYDAIIGFPWLLAVNPDIQ